DAVHVHSDSPAIVWLFVLQKITVIIRQEKIKSCKKRNLLQTFITKLDKHNIYLK
ncbi:hypothetical protein X975_11975, partial [Stegodyphus mimosarum]